MTFSELGEQITDPNKKWEDTLKEWVDEPIKVVSDVEFDVE